MIKLELLLGLQCEPENLQIQIALLQIVRVELYF